MAHNLTSYNINVIFHYAYSEAILYMVHFLLRTKNLSTQKVSKFPNKHDGQGSCFPNAVSPWEQTKIIYLLFSAQQPDFTVHYIKLPAKESLFDSTIL